MSKIFADVREYQDQACAAGFYHTTNLVLSYLHVQILESRHFDCSDWSGGRLTCVWRWRKVFALAFALWGDQTLRRGNSGSTWPFRWVGGAKCGHLRHKPPARLGMLSYFSLQVQCRPALLISPEESKKQVWYIRKPLISEQWCGGLNSSWCTQEQHPFLIKTHKCFQVFNAVLRIQSMKRKEWSVWITVSQEKRESFKYMAGNNPVLARKWTAWPISEIYDSLQIQRTSMKMCSNM